jgi:type I restriction enzyme M protein
VLVINADKLFRRGRNQNTLEQQHAERIFAAYTLFADEPGFAHVVDAAEIAAQNHNLNIPLYVAQPDDGDTVTPEQAFADLEGAQRAARVSRAALEEQLTAWGLT